MCRLRNCIREFTTGTIDNVGDDSFLGHIALSHFHFCRSVLFLLLYYVKVIPLLESLFRRGYFARLILHWNVRLGGNKRMLFLFFGHVMASNVFIDSL
jgi:hypothetical protein